MIYRCFAVLVILHFSNSEHNNVCSSFIDYYIKDMSLRCWRNEDIYLNVSDVAIKHGYLFESHTVTTEDGYIIKVFKISRSTNTRGNIFLQHPATGISKIWVDKGNDSLAFMLADAGYHIWLGNVRGSFYAKGHTNLSTESNEYWNWSFHETGLYDLPAQLRAVQEISKSTDGIVYIGHSMGVTSAIIYASLLPEQATKTLKLIISLAGVSHTRYARTIIRYLAPFDGIIMASAKALKKLELLPHSKFIEHVLSMCYKFPPFVKLCSYMLFPFMGYTPKQINPAWEPIKFTTNPGGVSLKCFMHYAQIYNAKGRFQMYDYKSDNLKYYGTTIPPKYPIENIRVPFYLHYGTKDLMAPKRDSLIFYSLLPDRAKYGIREVDGFSHIDFLYGKNVKEFVHQPIVKLINKMYSKH